MKRSDVLAHLKVWKLDLDKEGVLLVGFRTAGIGIYNDKLVWIGKEEHEFYEYDANTDPSRYYERVATLVGDRVYTYKIGKHGYNRPEGPYDAFRQAAPVMVDRYRNGRSYQREPLADTINIHRGGETTTSSAGCQTLPPELWNSFREVGYALLKKYGRQKGFKYLLLNRR